MGEQYFARRPASRRRPAEIRVSVRGRPFTFLTDAGVFSRGELDRGTELLLAALEVGPCELILDLGCGYGAIGIVAARLSDGGHVILTDLNERAVRLARGNVAEEELAREREDESDRGGRDGTRHRARRIGDNHTGAGHRCDVDRIVAEAPAHLREGGTLWLVARTKQGAESLRTRMAVAFGAADVVKRGGGFKVLRATKRTP